MQRCPICQGEVPETPRYPRAVCRACAERVCSADGRRLVFYNRDLSGGCMGRYADTQEEYPDWRCFIDGIPCRADEGRFGGIVIEIIG